jgi:hypothetical protein
MMAAGGAAPRTDTAATVRVSARAAAKVRPTWKTEGPAGTSAVDAAHPSMPRRPDRPSVQLWLKAAVLLALVVAAMGVLHRDLAQTGYLELARAVTGISPASSARARRSRCSHTCSGAATIFSPCDLRERASARAEPSGCRCSPTV